MSIAGALFAALSLAALVLARRPVSRLGHRLDAIAPRADRLRTPSRGDAELRDSGTALDGRRLGAIRVAAAMGAALAGAALSLAIPLGPLPVAAVAYAGYVAPAISISSRAAARRREAERATAVLVERVHALVAAGRPPETALAVLLSRPSGSPLLDRTLARAGDAYALGAPIFGALGAHAREDGLAACALFADDLDRARDLGRGSLLVIRERRDAMRGAERSRAIEAAAGVEGKLMLVLVLCYLPALVILVVIPLFIGLLEGLSL